MVWNDEPNQSMSKLNERVEALFQAAVALETEAQRADYLNRACPDPELRQEVESLLAAHEHPDALLATRLRSEASAGQAQSGAARPTLKLDLADAKDEAVGTSIGRYKLLERLGEGGCGVVYMAQQEEPIRRRVALKVIKMGMDTKSVIARFEAERQALALMDHPNIAKVLDAGATESGRPYFVMELVRGIKATDYCDQHQLSTRERLELFIHVCHAVQHAHQKGIIHRDLKPSNILVSSADGVPVPKVIDFGIAKATNQQPLTDKTLFTAFAQFMGTPAYMSPEQAELSALDIDTRSDIYSLGVLLYELLTGQPPFAPETLVNAGLDEMRRIIRETEPPRPSTRIETELTKHPQSAVPHAELKEIRGDLDWIVMKCLEKDRTRRYETANGLAADLTRHLENEPVVARPPSAAYRLQKTWRRHKLVFAAGAAVVAALVAGIAVSTWQAIKATKARQAAIQAQVAAQSAQNEAQQSREAEKQARLRADAKAAEAEKQAERADANARRFGKDLYVADMRLAQQAWEDASMGRLWELLDGQRPERTAGIDLRAFEWYYWQRLSHTDLLTLKGLDGALCVAFSPDGKRLATSGHNSQLNLWDPNTGEKILSLKGHRSSVRVVAFSPDGTRLASAEESSPSGMKIWDAATGKEILSLKGHPSSVRSLAFSPDGKHLASAGEDRTVRLWDTTTGQEVFSVIAGKTWVNSVAFSPDGTRLASASWSGVLWGEGGEVKLWDASTGKETLTFKRHNGHAFSVAFSPDGRRLASGGSDGVRVWDTTTGQEAAPFKSAKRGVGSVVFSPDGQRLASSDGPTLKVWDGSTGKEILSLNGPVGWISGLAFSPDGKRLASADGVCVKVWDATTSQEPLTVKWRPNTGAFGVAFSPDGKRLATANWDAAVRVLDATTGGEIFSLKGHTGSVMSVAFSPDGRRLVSGGDDRTVRLWDLTTGLELRTLKGPTGKVNSVAFSPDGSRVASADGDGSQEAVGEAKVWDAATGREILSLTVPTPDRVHLHLTSVAFSPDGKSLAAGVWGGYARPTGEWVSGEVLIWDAVTGQVKFSLGGVFQPNSVAFSPDGKSLAASSKVWDTTTGREICTLKWPGGVNSIAFSPDGKRLATGDDQFTLRIWDATIGQEILTLKEHTDRIYSVAFSPDGTRLASVSQDGTLKVREAARTEQVPPGQKQEQGAAR